MGLSVRRVWSQMTHVIICCTLASPRNVGLTRAIFGYGLPVMVQSSRLNSSHDFAPCASCSVNIGACHQSAIGLIRSTS